MALKDSAGLFQVAWGLVQSKKLMWCCDTSLCEESE